MKCPKCKEVGIDTEMINKGGSDYVTVLWECPVDACGNQIAEF